MPAIQLTDLAALPDVLGDFRFELLVTPPNADQLGMRDLQLRCQSVSFPGSNIEPMVVGLNGFTFYFRGRKMFDGMITATFIETSDGIVWSTLKNWQEAIVGTVSGNGLPKAEYVSANSLLNVYNEQGDEPANFAQMYNLWPTDVPQVQLDGQASNPFMITCSFHYDWCEFSNVPML